MIFTCPQCSTAINVRRLPVHCCGVRHDDDSAAIRDGELPPKTRRAKSPSTLAGINCDHRGAELRRAGCTTCTSAIRVFACALHGECSLGKKDAGVWRCEECADDTGSGE